MSVIVLAPETGHVVVAGIYKHLLSLPISAFPLLSGSSSAAQGFFNWWGDLKLLS